MHLLRAVSCAVLGATSAGLEFQSVRPTFRTGLATRQCHVHTCETMDEPIWKCGKRLGHLMPIGSQALMHKVPHLKAVGSGEFYERFLAAAQPIMLSGVASKATGGVEWDDRFLENICFTDSGRLWTPLIEVNKIIVSNTRWPIMFDWTFCDFIRNYTKPEFDDLLYVVSPLTEPGVRLGKHLSIPSVLRCSELHEAIHDTRLWMSGGNTSSSLHFDTHENLMLQVCRSTAHGRMADTALHSTMPHARARVLLVGVRLWVSRSAALLGCWRVVST